MKERRQYKRIRIDLPAQCKIYGPQEICFSTKVYDISPGGICFLTNDRIELGTQAEIQIDLDNNEKITMKAKVAWSEGPRGAEPAMAGVKIVDIAKQDLEKFVYFYCQRLFSFLMSRKKILIIEDEKDMVDLLTYELKQKEYDVVSACDGQEGFTKYLEEWPDLIILDLSLPKLNGYEVCRKIRREKNDTKTPIIMLTARDQEADKIIGSVLGAEKYITKPFDSEHLLSEIDKCLKAN